MVRVVVSTRRVRVLPASVVVILQLLAAVAAAKEPLPPAKNCTSRCGDIRIEYPFGVELGCYHAVGFNLTCNHSYHPPRLFLGDGTVQVLDISIPDATVRINSSRIEFDGSNNSSANATWGGGLPDGGPFFLSESESSIVVLMGCNILVEVREPGGNHSLIASCASICPSLWTDDGHGEIISITNECSGIYMVDNGFNYTAFSFSIETPPLRLPALLEWVISNSTSTTCPKNGSAPECLSAHSTCRDMYPAAHEGYHCECSDGYQGNPYITDGCEDINECLHPDIYPCYGRCINTQGGYNCNCLDGFKGNATIPTGCQDIDECADKEAHPCYGLCINMRGSFSCQCPNGTYGDATKKEGCTAAKYSLTGSSIALIVSGGSIFLLLILATPFVARMVKQHREKKLKDKFYKQNHGLLLQQLISKNTDFGDRMIITLEELRKATNNFDKSRQVGDGGHGIVFKGILDLHVVAIKKSKIIVQREIGEFINEVAILSQINHRNVVKLLGCCLETEVPLLVYEFISNGTLYHHLHVEGPISLSWDDRLRILLEVARALSYLHSASSMPIYHRDIKSSNILLDDSLTAKISDFGASKYTPIDRSEITTAVQGTIGYLDPMYYYTGRLTDKSDVFSFGVLLVELLTRKKPVADTFDGDSLVSYFALLLSEGNLIDIIDPQVKEEEGGEVHEVAALAALCTKLKGEERPSMREVEMVLENILSEKGPFHKGNRESSRPSKSQISALYMSIEGVATEASRQSMEEEMLSFPR